MSNFLEQYGKALFVLVLIAILIAFASPLGIKIKEYTLARVDNLKQISDDLISGKPRVDPNEPKEAMDYVYACLYNDGELVLSANEINPTKEILNNYGKSNVYKIKWDNNCQKVKSVNILTPIKPKSCQNWFISSKQEDSNFYKLEMNCLSVYTLCIHD